MAVERTLAILKPDCVRKNLQGEIILRIQKAGFKIIGMKKIRLTKEEASAFYAVHYGKPFYNDLIKFMMSGYCVPMVLEKENAIADFRKLIGTTDPQKAAEGTIRKLYAENERENIIHGSDSQKNSKREIAFFFSEAELV